MRHRLGDPLTRRLDGAARDAIDATRNSHSEPPPAARPNFITVKHTLVFIRQLDLDRRRVVLYFLQELFMSAGPGPLELLGRARFSFRAALQC